MSADSPDLDPSEPSGHGSATIFVSDPSAEADRLSTALRGRGYAVIDVPLSLLVARVAVQTPSLILLDIDAEGALEVAARLRDIPGAESIDILFLGAAGKTLSAAGEALRQEGSGFLVRPVSVQALIRKVDALIGARETDKPPSSVLSAPPSMRASSPLIDRASPSSGRGRRTPLPPVWSERPAATASAEDALEPSFGTGAPPATRLPLPALSPEIERLLQGAEDRSAHELGPVSSLAPPVSEPPSPDEEVDAVLPAEVLAALDEPLDENDDDLESDSGFSTGIPRRGNTGVPEALTSSGPQGAPGDHTVHRPKTNAPKSTLTGEREPKSGDPRFVSPSSYAVGDNADPKEKETPRPPRRGAGAGSLSPAGMQVPPSRESRVGLTAPPESVSSQLSATVPPGPPSRTHRPSSPPLSTVFSSPPLSADGFLGEGRSSRGSSPPPGFVSAPPTTSPTEMRSLGDLGTPQTPRSLGPAPPPPRRSDSGFPTESIPESLAPSFDLPEVLGPGDAIVAFAICVRERAAGALCIDAPEGVRRILLRDGDVVTAASGLDEESLVAFLGTRGDIAREVARQLNGKVPAFGRHAGAALVANGHISQDQLWPVLRAHAEWILRCAISAEKGTASFDTTPPGRLKAEPSVFGGATGAEVLIEVVRRAVPAQSALLRLGGGSVRLIDGPRRELLSECALPENELRWLTQIKGGTLDEVLATGEHLDLGPMVYALVQLGVLAIASPPTRSRQKRVSSPSKFDPIDAEALRSQVKTRLGLVLEGDYFSLLGVPRTATAYDIHRAYVELRRGLEPSRILNAATADLADDIQLIIEVLDEAHDILRDQVRRERYRRAIEDKPPI